MANSINTDNFSTNTASRKRHLDGQSASRERDPASAGAAHRTDDRADIERARLRLAQEVSHGPAIGNRAQALERLAELREQLAADPRAALQAHGRAGATLFEAATARPAV